MFSSFDHLSPSASGGAAPPSGLLGTKREDRAPVWRPNSSGCRPLLSLPSGGGRSSSSSRAPTAPATELKLVRASQLVGFATTEELARAEAVISLSVRLLHRRVPPPPLRIPLHMSCRGDIVLLPARRVGLTFSSTMRFKLCPACYRQGPRGGRPPPRAMWDLRTGSVAPGGEEQVTRERLCSASLFTMERGVAPPDAVEGAWTWSRSSR